MSKQHLALLRSRHVDGARAVNVNEVHDANQRQGFNQRVAIGMTNLFQAMPTFWLILSWIVLWIVANATIAHFDLMPWPLLLTLASVPQLPLMIVIMVGQGLLGRHQELQAEEQYLTTLKTYHDLEQVMLHLDLQDSRLIAMTEHLQEQDKLLVQAVAALQQGKQDG